MDFSICEDDYMDPETEIELHNAGFRSGKIESKEAWLKTQKFQGPTVEAVQFLGYGFDYPIWFENMMECDIYLEFGTYFYEDLALTDGCYFLRNRLGTICCIDELDFHEYYCTLPF